jgi:hypothetical protein
MATAFVLWLRGNKLWNIVYRHANFDYKQALHIRQFSQFYDGVEVELEIYAGANVLRC